jgi:enediyne biosynthesis protein E4
MRYFILSFFLLGFGKISLAQNGFSKVNSSAFNFSSPNQYRGAAWVDVDNDGDIDLFAAPKWMLRNDGNGVFVLDTNSITLLVSSQGPVGSTWGDVDNDGDIDCYLVRSPSRLFLNDGLGNFTQVTSGPIAAANYAGWGGALGDMNNDGKLDLVVAHPAGFLGNPEPCFFFVQDAAGVFQRITDYEFTDSLNPYTVPYWSDFDLDNDADLFIATGPGGSAGPDYLFKNMLTETGNDTFVRMTSSPVFGNQLQDGQCYNFIDTDNDGDKDLCLTNWQGAVSRFYRNDGDTVYTPLSQPFTSQQIGSLGNCWGDYDNDSDLDVIIANDAANPIRLYRNDGNNAFVLLTDTFSNYTGASCPVNGDYDNDGDLDLFVMGILPARGLYRNDQLAGTNAWVSFKCNGTVSNRSAIGAHIRIKAIINGQPVWQLREISAQNSFQGQNDLRVHFGLGDATVIDSVIIQYPSGITDIFTAVPVQRFFEATEGQSILLDYTAINQQNAESIHPIRIWPNPANDFLHIEMTGEIEYDKVHWTIYDASGKKIKTGKDIVASNRFSVSLAFLQPGFYSIEIESSKPIGSIQFLKQ